MIERPTPAETPDSKREGKVADPAILQAELAITRAERLLLAAERAIARARAALRRFGPRDR